MRRIGAAVVLAAVATVAVTAPGCGSSPPHAPGPPHGGDGERIESHVVPGPAGVTAPRFPWWSADGERLLFSGTPEGGERAEVLSIRPDGTGLACLSCDVATEVAEPLLKPLAFPDGRRVAVRVGNQSPVTPADHAILECTPSVARCDEAELVPVVVPAADDPGVLQDQRELRVAPDGEHVGFTQLRAGEDGEGVLLAVVATIRRTATAYELDDARVVSTRGELKSFTPDGRAVLVAAFAASPYEAGNPDVMRVDLATGVEERVTSHPDYDEPVEMSPDGRWYAVGSGRGSGLFETVSQVRRPALLGTALDPLVGSLFLRHRDELLEPWLVRTGSEGRGEAGRRLPGGGGAGWDGRAIPNWRPDGTAIVFWEGRDGAFEANPTDTRLVVAELVDRRPVRRRPAASMGTPGWAPALSGFVPRPAPAPESRDGRRSGSVAVEVTPVDGGRVVEVTYRGFSDDGAWVVDGTERAERRDGETTYTADLTLSGRHEGYLRADAVIALGGIEGEITSEVDGRRLTLPAPAATPTGGG